MGEHILAGSEVPAPVSLPYPLTGQEGKEFRNGWDFNDKGEGIPSMSLS